MHFTKLIFKIKVIVSISMMTLLGSVSFGGVANTLKQETIRIVEDFTHSHLQQRTQSSMNIMVARGIYSLRDHKFNDVANEYEKQWNNNYSNYFLNMNLMDLGDHRPLFKWLADFHEVLKKNLGESVCEAMELNDLRVLNFGIPVVFHPNGDPVSADKWDKGEYQKHFVPLTGVVLSWSLKAICDSTFSGFTNRFCKAIVQVPRAGYEKWVAPKISDYVFESSHTQNPHSLGSAGDLHLTSSMGSETLLQPLEVLWPLTEEQQEQ